MKKRTIIKTSDTISMSIAQIPSISSHSSLPYVSEVFYLGKELN